MSFDFNLFGFPVRVTSGALLLAGVVLIFGLSSGGIAGSLVWLAVAALSILVHELGHAFTARSFGLGPVSIVLHGFGGLATHQRARKPTTSLLISLAGPAAGLLLVPVALGLSAALPATVPSLVALAVSALLWINLVWSGFNLLPIYPMDGGQALHAVLTMVVPAKALLITAGTGLAGAVLLGLVFLGLGDWWVVFVAGMIGHQNYQLLQRLGWGRRR